MCISLSGTNNSVVNCNRINVKIFEIYLKKKKKLKNKKTYVCLYTHFGLKITIYSSG